MQFGRSYEEFEVGATYKHWPGKTVTEYDDHLFCLLTMNHHPLHLDAHYAEHSTQFGKNVVVGNYVYSLLLGMSVPDVSGRAIANLEVESLRHHGTGRARLRAPFEPHLVVLAAAALSGEHRKPRSLALAGAALVSLAFALMVLPQLPRSFAARGDYGVHWPLDPLPKRSALFGRAGFNVFAPDGEIEILVRPRNGEKSTRLTVTLDGKVVEEVETDSIEHRIRQAAPGVDLVHVEIEVRDARTGEPVRALVVVPAPANRLRKNEG